MGNQLAYVEAASQIIPVLALALLADRRRQPAYTYVVLIALLAGVVGEVAALYAIGIGTNGKLNIIVSAAMSTLGAAILAPHLPTYVINAIYGIPPLWRFVMARVFEVYILLPGLVLSTWGWSFWPVTITAVATIYPSYTAWRAIQGRRQWLKDNPQQVHFNVFSEADLEAADEIDNLRRMANLGLDGTAVAALKEDARKRYEKKQARKLARRRKKIRKAGRPSSED